MTSVRFYECCRHRQTRLRRLPTTFTNERANLLSQSHILSDNGIKYVDIVRDVLRYVPLYWTATELVCDLKAVLSDIADEYPNWMNRLA